MKIAPPASTYWITACLAFSLSRHALNGAAAVPVGAGSGPETVTQHEYQVDYGAWFVADLSDPITPAPLPFTTSLTAGLWTQQLTFGDGFPALQTGDTFLVQELLQYGGGDFPLTNWAQEILSPDWQWSDGSIFDNNTAEPLSGLQLSLSGSRIQFDFESVDVGSDLFLVKTLEYVGPNGAAPSPFSVQASVAVPEARPVTLLLLAAAGLVVVRCQRAASRGGRNSRSV